MRAGLWWVLFLMGWMVDWVVRGSLLDSVERKSPWGYPLNGKSLQSMDRVYGLDLGDYDADGQTDLLLTGPTYACPGASTAVVGPRLYRQNALAFEDATAAMLDVAVGPVHNAAFLPRPEDGTLDIIYCTDSLLAWMRYIPDSSHYEDASDRLVPHSAPCLGGEFASLLVKDIDLDGDSEVLVMDGSSFYAYARWKNGSLHDSTTEWFPNDPPVVVNGSSMALGSLASNGLLDLLITSVRGGQLESAVYMQLDNHTFSYLSNAWIAGALDGTLAVGDLVGNGLPDVVVAGTFLDGLTGVRVYRNNGQLEFLLVEQPLPSEVAKQPVTAAFAVELFSAANDAVDLILTGENLTQSYILRNDGRGNFTIDSRAPAPVHYARLAYSNSLVSKQRGVVLAGLIPSLTLPVFMGYAYPTDPSDFTDVTESFFSEEAYLLSILHPTANALDLTGDGCLDLYLGGRFTLPIGMRTLGSVFQGDCKGNFTRINLSAPELWMGYALWNDFDGDGAPEVYANGLNKYAVRSQWYTTYFANGSSSPHSPSTYLNPVPPVTLHGTGTLFDLDSDRRMDMLLTGNGASEYITGGFPFSVYRNLGNLSFEDVTERFLPVPVGVTRGCVAVLEDSAYIYMSGSPTVSRKNLEWVFYSRMANNSYVVARELFLFNVPAVDSCISVALNFGVAAADARAVPTTLAQKHLYVSGRTENNEIQAFLAVQLNNGSYADQSGSLPSSSWVAYGYAALFDAEPKDGFWDVFLQGVRAGVDGKLHLAVLRNMGNGTFFDGTKALLPSDVPGYSQGMVLAASLNSAVDNVTDLLAVGHSSACGFTLLLSGQSPAPGVSNDTSSLTLTAVASALPSTSGSATSQQQESFSSLLSNELGNFMIFGITLASSAGLFATLVVCGCALCVAVVALLSGVLCAGLLCVLTSLLLCLLLLSSFMGTITSVGYLWSRARRGELAHHPTAAAASESPPADVMDPFLSPTMRLMGEGYAFSPSAAEAFARNLCGDCAILEFCDVHILEQLPTTPADQLSCRIYLAEWRGAQVVVKQFDTPTIGSQLERILHEARMMSLAGHHPRVVDLIGITVGPETVGLVESYCAGGNLCEALLQQDRLTSIEAKCTVLTEVASAVVFLHSLNMVHRDLAARNVLLDRSGHARLADFGMARLLNETDAPSSVASFAFPEDEESGNCLDLLGPVRWMAPEQLHLGEDTRASDCWAFGVLMFEVWSDGGLPYGANASVAEVVLNIRAGGCPGVPTATPPELGELMTLLWSANPVSRPSMTVVHEWLRKFLDTVSNSKNSTLVDSSDFVKLPTEISEASHYSDLCKLSTC